MWECSPEAIDAGFSDWAATKVPLHRIKQRHKTLHEQGWDGCHTFKSALHI